MTEETGRLADIVKRGAEGLGLTLPRGAEAAFQRYYELLSQRGRSVNLTAISDEDDVARLHFLDSLAIMGAADFAGKQVIDIGSGAGFPGMPLKIAQPSINLTMLDATGKRIAFLEELCDELGIKAACVHARAEEAARNNEMRARFDIALSRAVARLNVLCELCLPFLRVGGEFLAMKSVDSDEEIKEAENAIQKLGAQIETIKDYTIPETDITHRVIIIRKTAPTTEEYPRRFAKIQKSPL